MRRGAILLILVSVSGPSLAGPLSKFDSKVPQGTFTSPRQIDDLERCLLDLPKYGLAQVYKQADRPGVTEILWSSGTAIAVGRVTLRQQATGTTIVSWMDRQDIAPCLKPAASSSG